MQIEVKSTDVRTENVTSKDGKSYTFRRQDGWVMLDGEYRKINLSLTPENKGWPVGKYTIDDKSFFIGRFGDLGFRSQMALQAVR